MESRWSEIECRKTVELYRRQGIGEEIARRVYTTRLLGQDPQLVLHGGGNTSLKTDALDTFGAKIDVLRVKGSGWDMADIEPAGLPELRLDPLRQLRDLDELTDKAMVNFERQQLLDSNSPNPSVETLLHAFLPGKFIDHTHSTAVLSLTNQPEGKEMCLDLFGDSVGIVPYIMPGFDLSKSAVEVFENNPNIEGLILLKHGVFTFGETARDSYESMINLVSQVEKRLAMGKNHIFQTDTLPIKLMTAPEIAPMIRGACAIKDDNGYDGYKRFILDFRSSGSILNYVNGSELERYSQSGVATPDHTIRTKNWPMLLPAPNANDVESFRDVITNTVKDYSKRYHEYFVRNSKRHRDAKTELDPIPRVILVRGVGLFGLGRTTHEAMIAADIAENTVETVTAAESIGQFESASETDLFDIEYWSLEQAKLGAKYELLAGCVVLVTGGSGTIGKATCNVFADAGATVVVIDMPGKDPSRTANELGKGAIGIECDVTNAESVDAAFNRICGSLGGIDIIVSNAGTAWQGKIGDVADQVLRDSFELNFFAHQSVAKNAVRILRKQSIGGVLLFNASKQAVNPGLDFGPYGLPKTATLALARQYAIDYGSEGIRANAVNADRIRSGILTDQMISSRSTARGVSEADYMSGNILGVEVTAIDVAQAFLHQALSTKTTAGITTVDGGNIAAAPR